MLLQAKQLITFLQYCTYKISKGSEFSTKISLYSCFFFYNLKLHFCVFLSFRGIYFVSDKMSIDNTIYCIQNEWYVRSAVLFEFAGVYSTYYYSFRPILPHFKGGRVNQTLRL